MVIIVVLKTPQLRGHEINSQKSTENLPNIYAIFRTQEFHYIFIGYSSVLAEFKKNSNVLNETLVSRTRTVSINHKSNMTSHGLVYIVETVRGVYQSYKYSCVLYCSAWASPVHFLNIT